MPHQRQVLLTFAADDKVTELRIEPASSRGELGYAVVDPERGGGKLRPVCHAR